MPTDGPPRHQRQRGRSVHQQGRLLELRPQVHRRLGARWLVPGLLRHAAAPGGREHRPVRLSRGRSRSRTGTSTPTAARTPPFVVRDCQGGTCAYYQYLQGTSMASPHAVGVAALIISQFGKRDGGKSSDQLKMKPERGREDPGTDGHRPRLSGPAHHQLRERGSPRRPGTPRASARPQFNSFWGDGIVDALRAVSGK